MPILRLDTSAGNALPLHCCVTAFTTEDLTQDHKLELVGMIKALYDSKQDNAEDGNSSIVDNTSIKSRLVAKIGGSNAGLCKLLDEVLENTDAVDTLQIEQLTKGQTPSTSILHGSQTAQAEVPAEPDIPWKQLCIETPQGDLIAYVSTTKWVLLRNLDASIPSSVVVILSIKAEVLPDFQLLAELLSPFPNVPVLERRNGGDISKMKSASLESNQTSHTSTDTVNFEGSSSSRRRARTSYGPRPTNIKHSRVRASESQVPRHMPSADIPRDFSTYSQGT